LYKKYSLLKFDFDFVVISQLVKSWIFWECNINLI